MASTVQLSTQDYLGFVDRALDGMTATLGELGDELANRSLDVPGSNSPYAIVTHCLGVMEYWAGHQVAGRPDERDRTAEFRATGAVDDLVKRVRSAREQLAGDVAVADPEQPCRGEVHARHGPCTQGWALVHVLEELMQHHGHLEITADVLRAEPASGGI